MCYSVSMSFDKFVHRILDGFGLAIFGHLMHTIHLVLLPGTNVGVSVIKDHVGVPIFLVGNPGAFVMGAIDPSLFTISTLQITCPLADVDRVIATVMEMTHSTLESSFELSLIFVSRNVSNNAASMFNTVIDQIASIGGIVTRRGFQDTVPHESKIWIIEAFYLSQSQEVVLEFHKVGRGWFFNFIPIKLNVVRFIELLNIFVFLVKDPSFSPTLDQIEHTTSFVVDPISFVSVAIVHRVESPPVHLVFLVFTGIYCTRRPLLHAVSFFEVPDPGACMNRSVGLVVEPAGSLLKTLVEFSLVHVA